MNLMRSIKKKIKNSINKRGSYILEATISLPIFIIAIIALALIINIIAICESISFYQVKAMKKLALEAYIIEKPVLVKGRMSSEIYKQNPALRDFKVKNFDYLYEENKIEDLISIDTVSNFRVKQPLGIKGQIKFDLSYMNRAFTGKLEDGKPLDESIFKEGGEGYEAVIFPKYGNRFHRKNCRYVKLDYKGEEYKIEIDSEDAKHKGYTPCLICGG